MRHVSKTANRPNFPGLRLLASMVLAISCLLAASIPATAQSKAASIVIDARTGKTLYESNADAARFPASLTKMMTLYMVFEALESGKISKSTPVTFSKNAAAEPPTKLGVPAGKSVSVETIIYSLVTKSANDSATAIGELLGGSEENFTRMMTAKARQLGMKNSVFRNAHGLPNSGQRSTARDLARLGIALREHFPQHYHYFSTKSFAYGKQRIGNHNKLLGRVKGVDGIKTGYTRASGFNLVSSVQADGRSIVAVVMGGASGASRDREMQALIQKYLPAASTGRSGRDLIAKSDSPIKNLAKAILLPKKDAPKPDFRPEEPEQALEVAEVEIEEAEPVMAEAASDVVLPFGRASVEEGSAGSEQVEVYAEPIPERLGRAVDPVKTASVKPASEAPSEAPSGWAVQVASSPSQAEAEGFLDKTSRAASAALASAKGYTVPFEKNGKIFYRARFGGFASKDMAWGACNALKKKRIACYAVQQ